MSGPPVVPDPIFDLCLRQTPEEEEEDEDNGKETEHEEDNDEDGYSE